MILMAMINCTKKLNSAYEIIRLKGYTSWAIGVSCATICRSFVKNTRNVFSVTTAVKGYHGIEQDVFLSLPCVLGENGITHTINQILDDQEIAQIQRSAKTLWEVQDGIKF